MGPQETQDEKELLIKQSEELLTQKAKIDETQKGLVAKREKLQKELDDFAELQEAAKVRCNP